ncbi:WecB/TagA/CpsF family glycosyltransferase [Mucilaginibacter calamicampi]|uniref:WecB/TagA/CpsF family glycosyltransferase n=1 Tax=Mucilaginibacter calamicampi TaxID=1302352 RepID=A0ABW2YY87_9SPHI
MNSKYVINTINQYSYVVAERDAEFKQSLLQSDILLPDGIGIVVATKIIKGKRIKKIAGADLHKYLLEELNLVGGKCFYLGSSNDTLMRIKDRITHDYPSINFGCYSPPYKPVFSEEDNQIMIDKVNSFMPTVLFVGMTAPKQEKWVYEHKDQLNVNIICSIGAVFDFYAGTIKRPNRFMIKIGMEWMGRLSNQPKRLWKRYVYYGPVFVADLVKDIFSSISNKGG